MIIAELLGNGACPARVVLDLAPGSDKNVMRLFPDVYQATLGCTVDSGDPRHDMHSHVSADGVLVAAWYE